MGSSSSSAVSSLPAVGNTLHCVGLALNVAVTAAIMLQYPTPETYDDNWKRHGQCHVEWWNGSNTTVYCAAVLVASGLGLLSLGLMNNYNTATTSMMNEQLARRCQVMSMANLSHGLGHLFVNLIGNAIPPIEFVWRADAVGYLLVLAAFWPTVFMATISDLTVGPAVVGSIVVLACQVALNVPPHLAFTYSQSVILVAQSLDQLVATPAAVKQRYGTTYVAFAMYYLPMFPLMWMETTQCTSLLAPYGGHLVYDLYLSVMPFVVVYLISQQDHTTTQTKLKSI